MKKITITLLMLVASIGCFPQGNIDPVEKTVLNNFTFDNDTNVYYGIKNNYEWCLQVQAASLTGTLDGTVKIYHKMSGSQFDWVEYDDSAIDTINDASYKHIFVSNELTADSIRIEFKNENITGGTLNSKLNLHKKR